MGGGRLQTTRTGEGSAAPQKEVGAGRASPKPRARVSGESAVEGADRGPGVRGASCRPGQVWGREPPRSAAGVALSSGLEKKPEGAACVTQRQVPGAGSVAGPGDHAGSLRQGAGLFFSYRTFLSPSDKWVMNKEKRLLSWTRQTSVGRSVPGGLGGGVCREDGEGRGRCPHES